MSEFQNNRTADRLLSVEGLSKKYGRVHVFENVNLDLFDGDRILLAGPNGHGKSTFLRALAGITKPTRGRITRSRSFRTKRIGYMSQAGGMYPNLTIAQNIVMARRAYGISENTDFRSMSFLFDLGLDQILDRTFGALSVGFQRLSTLALALSINPSALFLDEPFSSLDQEKTLAALSVIEKYVKNSQLIIASHHHGGTLPFEPTRLIAAANNGIVDGPNPDTGDVIATFVNSSSPPGGSK